MRGNFVVVTRRPVWSMMMLVALLLAFNYLNVEAQSSVASVKPLPKFTQTTLTKVENIVLYDNAPLKTG